MKLHLTNVTGAGASQLLLSLLPAIEQNINLKTKKIYLPNKGLLQNYKSINGLSEVYVYNRFLPNIVSRLIECMFLSKKFDDQSPLLVLGDIPLRVKCPQTVFVQQSHLIKPNIFRWKLSYFKYMIARLIFRLNSSRVSSFIVQSNIMKERLETSYPSIKGKVHVVSQPVPNWLLNSGIKRVKRSINDKSNLKLIYPSSDYSHKNHKLLSKINPNGDYPISDLILTLDKNSNPAPHFPWVKCVGFLSSEELKKIYSIVDGLIFLSIEESYGFPLVEAMFVGIPIICPDLPYARNLCGDKAIYFDSDSPESLMLAIKKLKKMLDSGWWPSWDSQMQSIPSNWKITAAQIIEIILSSSKINNN